MHSSVLILCCLVVWRTAQILKKKDLSFWAGLTKAGSALFSSASAKSIFLHTANKKNVRREAVEKLSTCVEMTHKT